MTRFLASETDKGKIQEGFFSTVGFVFVTNLVVLLPFIYLLQPLLAPLWGCEKAVIELVAFVILANSLGAVCLVYFRTFRKMLTYLFFVVFQACAEIGLLTYLVLRGSGILEAVTALLIVRAFLFLVMFSLIVSKLGLGLPSFPRMREYLSYGLPYVPANVSGWIVSSSDRYVIAYFLGATFVGFYSPAYTLGNIISMFIAPLALVLPPYLFQLYDEGKKAEIQTYLRYSLKYFLILAIPSVFGLSLLARPILVVLSTHEIASKGYLVTPFTALSALSYGIYILVSPIIEMVKKTKLIGITWIAAAAINLLLNIVFVSLIGIRGAAVATLVAYVLATAITARFAAKYFVLRVDWVSILKSVIASVLMSVAILAMRSTSNLSSLLSSIALGVIVYLATFILLKGFKTEEIKFFRNLFSR
jgi:O-antigen/teichoic acid export membrane protein